MPDPVLVRAVLNQILAATHTVAQRVAPISSPADFLISDQGMEKLDALCMQLIAIGESVKHLDRLSNGELLPNYPAVEWKRIMGMRDVLSHHYFDIDAEVVFEVCRLHIPALGREVERILADLDA